MAAVDPGVLFLFKLPDVSRLFLLILFPTQFLVALATRAALRLVFRRLRARGQQPALRARRRRRAARPGVRRQAGGPPRARPARHRLPRRRAGVRPAAAAGRTSAAWTTSRQSSTSDVVDEVAICLPFSQWDLVDAIAHIVRGGGQDRPGPDGRPGPRVRAGRVEELDGTPVFSLVSGPDRALALAAKRLIDVAVVGARARRCSARSFAAVALAIRREDGRPVLFRQTAWASTAARSRSSSSGRWCPTRRRATPSSWTGPTRAPSSDRRPAGHADRARSCAGRASTSCPSSGTSCAAR